MLVELTTYRLLLLLSVVAALAVADRMRRHQTAPARESLTIFNLAMAEWALAALLADLTHDRDLKVLLNAATYVGIAATPVAWLAISLQYAGFRRSLTPARVLLLALVPAGSVVMACTNGMHGLFWTDVVVRHGSAGATLDLTPGPGFTVHILYSYALLTAGAALMARTILDSSTRYRRQTTIYLIAAALPWSVNLHYHLGLEPFPGRDATPAVFGFSALLMAAGLSRSRLLDVVPVARSAILRELTDAVIVVDIVQRIAELNPAASRILGIAPADAIGRPVAAVLVAHPSLLRQCTDSPDSRAEVQLKVDGRERFYDVRGVRLRDRSDNPVAQLLVLHDITERRRAELELAEYRDHLQELVEKRTGQLMQSRDQLRQSERLASLGTLAAGIAHEINNPLTVIRLATDHAHNLEGGRDADGALRKVIRDIAAQAERCDRIVQSVLQLSRGAPTERWKLDLNDVVQRSCDLTAASAAQRLAQVQVRPSYADAVVSANPIEMEQVLVNLVQNAIESRREGAQVIVRTERLAESIRIEVRDNGRGIEEEARQHVFDPFYTTREREGGTGLGLSVAHSIIANHGGTMGIESQLGQGTTVTIDLPRAS
jgi:PAS domain S-box-containing protein